jgi:SNF2 family DNA or RNA helicase
MQVDILADRIVATPATHLERLHLMSLPNSHLRKDGAYWYPMEWTTLGDLVLDFGHGVLTPTAMAAYEAHQREQSYLTSIQLDDGLTAEFILERVPWHAKLYDYQLRGAAWLATARRGILGDEPGLGKTLQAITAVEAKASYPALVITMNSVKLHWQRQIEQWTGSTDVAVAQGSDTGKRLEAIQSDAQWIVINHEMLRSESYRQALLQRPWGTVIVDEAHKLQGRHSQVSEQAAKLRTQNLFMLTGTPVWNKADSIWRLLYLLDPARFRSYWQFDRRVLRRQSDAVGQRGAGHQP